ncbi:uncharacterized protein [Antedon mediterranea]|uniref:uncharacterized protein n=1 Tax=Antedon mediterranea TaxID=105859 RepID=UPI003AF627FC
MEEVLQQNKVPRQAYHGKAFVGNHVHKCCQVDIIHQLTSASNRVLEEQSSDIPIGFLGKLQSRLKKIDVTYTPIFHQFSDIHKAINHTNAMTENEIDIVDAEQ